MVHSRGTGRRCCCNTPTRRGAHLWREGWSYGFVDALRLAARHTDDPQVWMLLSRLAVRYGPDGFGRQRPDDHEPGGRR